MIHQTIKESNKKGLAHISLRPALKLSPLKERSNFCENYQKPLQLQKQG